MIKIPNGKIPKLDGKKVDTLQFIDYFGFRTNISKIDFGRQLNKLGLKSKLIQISGFRLNGYVLD